MGGDIGIGVIGLGWMGRVHTSAYRRVIEHFGDLDVTPRLVLASDVSPERRAQAERLGFAGTTEDWRAVVAHPGVQAISVTTPNNLHREIAIAAIEAGKHVWVEKPVGRGLEDTIAVADARGARASSAASASATASPPPWRTPAGSSRPVRSATSTTTAACSWPTTPTARTPPPRGASTAPTRARARWAT